MGTEEKTTSAFALGNEPASAWFEALDDVLKAAADTAEFHGDRAIGRSRTASIRRLKAALDHLEALENHLERAGISPRPK